MRVPYHLLQVRTFRSEPLLAAMAAVAFGMFVGTWLIGPALTHGDSSDTAVQATRERPSYQDMMSRPDPSPYRAATPAFDTAGAPQYAAAAKEKAQAELGGQVAADDDGLATEQPSFERPRGRTQSFDRHRIY